MKYISVISGKEERKKKETRQVQGSLGRGLASPSSEQPGHGLGQEAIPASGKSIWLWFFRKEL